MGETKRTLKVRLSEHRRFAGTYDSYKPHFDGIHIFTIFGGYLLLDDLLAMALH